MPIFFLEANFSWKEISESNFLDEQILWEQILGEEIWGVKFLGGIFVKFHSGKKRILGSKKCYVEERYGEQNFRENFW